MSAKTLPKTNGRVFHPSAVIAPQLTPEPGAIPLPEIEDLADLLNEAVPEPAELVAGLLHQGGKMVVGGGSKSYKTWLLTDLGLSVASGEEWLGCATVPGCVLYINLEIQRAFFRKRAASIKMEKSIEIARGQFDLWNLRGHAADLTAMLPRLLKGIGDKQYVLIIIDPIYKVLGNREENAAGDITSLCNELENLAVQSGAAVVFGAHFSKGNQASKDPMDRIGGSGVYARDPDALLTVTKHEEEDAYTIETTLRNLAPLPAFVVRWRHPLMIRDGSLDPTKLKQVTGRPSVHNADELLDLLNDSALTFGQWRDAAKEHAGMSEGTFKKLRRELVQAGRVHQSKIDQTYERVRKGNK